MVVASAALVGTLVGQPLLVQVVVELAGTAALVAKAETLGQ
jgi:hypothetical protein